MIRKNRKDNGSDATRRKREAAMKAMKAIGSQEQESESDAFMQLYASLMMLLMTFFIVIFSHSVTSQAKFELAKESLYKVFETAGVLKTREILLYLQSKMDRQEDQPRETSKVQISLEEVTQKMEEDFYGCEVDLQRYRTSITIPDGKVFKESSIALSSTGKAVAKSIAAYIKKENYKQIIIKSHFMSVIPDKSDKSSERKDWMNSSARSQIIARLLVKEGIDPLKIAALGLGSTQPLDRYITSPNSLPKQNRTELIIKTEISGADEQLYLEVS